MPRTSQQLRDDPMVNRHCLATLKQMGPLGWPFGVSPVFLLKNQKISTDDTKNCTSDLVYCQKRVHASIFTTYI